MSRTNRFLGGVTFGYINQFLFTVVGLWLTPFLLRRVGQHDYGLWLLGAQLLAYLSLMDLGIVALLPRTTAYATGRAGSVMNARDLPDIIGRTSWVVICQTPLVALAASVLWFTIPTAWGSLRNPIAIVLICFGLTFPLRIFAAVLQGLQDLTFLGKLNIFAWLSGTAITVGLIFAGKGLYSLALGWAATQFTIAAISYIRLRWKFSHVLPGHLPSWSWISVRAQLKQGFWVSMAQVAQLFVAGTDLLIIGSLLGPVAVVPYACTAKLISVLANQPQMLMQSAAPALSEMKMAESRAKLFRVCTALTQAMLLLSGAVACVVLTVNEGFINWWVGPDQYGGMLLSLLLVGAMLFRHWNITAVYAIFCFGYERRISITTLLDGAVTVAGAILLVHFFGAIGAPLGAIAGVCAVSLPFNLSALARESGVSITTTIKHLWSWFYRFVLLAMTASFLSHILLPQTFVAIAISGSLAVVGYTVIMLPIVLRDPLGAYVRPRVMGTFSRFRQFRLIRNADV